MRAEHHKGWLAEDRKEEETDLGLDLLPQQGSLALDEGVVQGCGLPRSAARSVYPRVDNGGACGPILPSTTPGGEHPRIRQSVLSGVLGTYKGRDRLVGEATL